MYNLRRGALKLLWWLVVARRYLIKSLYAVFALYLSHSLHSLHIVVLVVRRGMCAARLNDMIDLCLWNKLVLQPFLLFTSPTHTNSKTWPSRSCSSPACVWTCCNLIHMNIVLRQTTIFIFTRPPVNHLLYTRLSSQNKVLLRFTHRHTRGWSIVFPRGAWSILSGFRAAGMERFTWSYFPEQL